MASSRLHDDMSTSEWMRRRTEELKEASQARSQVRVVMQNPLDQLGAPTPQPQAQRQRSASQAVPPPAQAIDPRRTDVFRRGPDGKLYPIPGWRTTAPFEWDTWRRSIDWGGVADDFLNLGFRVAGQVAPLGKDGRGSPLPRKPIEQIPFVGGLYDMGKELYGDLKKTTQPPPQRPKR